MAGTSKVRITLCTEIQNEKRRETVCRSHASEGAAIARAGAYVRIAHLLRKAREPVGFSPRSFNACRGSANGQTVMDCHELRWACIPVSIDSETAG